MLPGDIKLVGFFGSESIGKTTTAHQIVGKLRAHGVLAEMMPDTSSTISFQPHLLDSHWTAWVNAITRKVAALTEASLRANVELLVCDRTPYDLFEYASYAHPNHPMIESMEPWVMNWLHHFDRLYFFPAEGTSYRVDGYREESDTRRENLDAIFHARLDDLRRVAPNLIIANGSYAERAHTVYNNLCHFLGIGLSEKVVGTVQEALRMHYGRTVHVTMTGSRSLDSMKAPRADSDYDLVAKVKGISIERAASGIDPEIHKWLESKLEATLEIIVTP